MRKLRLAPGLVLSLTIAWIVIGFLLAPMFISVPLSLTPERFLSMPDGELSLRHYETVFTSPAWLGALGDSAVVGIGATVLATVIGAAAAIGLWRIGGRAARIIGVLALMPMIVPPIVTALALSRSWVTLGLFDTVFGVILAHAILGMPFVFMTVSAALEGLDPRIVQAARSLGAGPFRVVRDVIVPNVKAGLLTGGLFAFVISWDEIIVTLFVSSRSVYTLPRKIWSDIRDNIDPAVAAVSTLMIGITVIVAVLYLLRDLMRAKSGEA
ncbi:ABC transporter permease [Zavarzinia compransoris]|uniref:ABC transporter permease n=1 Tax=Zavarzinia compransoris TaxID=1264899 RepID=A0A317E8T9_9PROT|nr:ABC transporter permease [Zavarzinia compransoris]PWR21723.1 ABC transporter permease [Zavarzinia compransoris]TDP45489.1 putative spermidine/putrescine transport system permease protein [Zavarzinia compransoris]